MYNRAIYTCLQKIRIKPRETQNLWRSVRYADTLTSGRTSQLHSFQFHVGLSNLTFLILYSGLISYVDSEYLIRLPRFSILTFLRNKVPIEPTSKYYIELKYADAKIVSVQYGKSSIQYDGNKLLIFVKSQTQFVQLRSPKSQIELRYLFG